MLWVVFHFILAVQYCGGTSGLPIKEKIEKTTIDRAIIANVSDCFSSHRITESQNG